MSKNRARFKVGIILGIVAASLVGSLTLLDSKTTAPGGDSQNNQTSSQNSQNTPQPFDKNRYSIHDPDSLWVIVNKKRPLPDSFIPQLTNVAGASLKKESAEAVDQLIDAADHENIKFKVISGYRSYQAQKNVYDSYVQKDGQAAADTYSARPGHSEHQTGLAADLGSSDGKCDLEICFADTPAGKWLVAHAHEYGFIIRYEKDKNQLTGYQYEPWHIRYVGKELAKELKNTGQTMEQFFGLQPALTY